MHPMVSSAIPPVQSEPSKQIDCSTESIWLWRQGGTYNTWYFLWVPHEWAYRTGLPLTYFTRWCKNQTTLLRLCISSGSETGIRKGNKSKVFQRDGFDLDSHMFMQFGIMEQPVCFHQFGHCGCRNLGLEKNSVGPTNPASCWWMRTAHCLSALEGLGVLFLSLNWWDSDRRGTIDGNGWNIFNVFFLAKINGIISILVDAYSGEHKRLLLFATKRKFYFQVVSRLCWTPHLRRLSHHQHESQWVHGFVVVEDHYWNYLLARTNKQGSRGDITNPSAIKLPLSSSYQRSGALTNP